MTECRLRCLGLALVGFAVLHGCGAYPLRLGASSRMAEVAPSDGTNATTSELAARLAELQARLQEKEKELGAARDEIERLRSLSVTDSQGQPRLEATTQAPADPGGISLRTVEDLAAELSRERSERLAVVRELERLRQEVSSPFAVNSVPEADYLALKQELVDLRRQFQKHEEEQRRLAERLALLPAEGQGPPPARPSEPARLSSEAADELAESRQRIAELEAAVESLREQGSKVTALATENDSLRSQLAEERRRAEALEAKLKVAARVTDLIFRMRSQNQGESSPPPVREPFD